MVGDGLKGFEGTAPLIQQPTEVSDVGLRSTIQASQDFTSRLKEFKDFKEKQLNREAQTTARDQAYRDAKENRPFSKKINNMYGSVYNEVRTATYAADAELQIAETSTELAMAYENDPEAYDNAMRGFVDGLSSAAPTEQLQSVIAIGGHKRRNESYGRLKIAEHGRIKAAQKETFVQSLGVNVAQIVELQATGDTKRAELEKQKNLKYIGTMAKIGIINVKEAQILIKKGEYQVTNGTAQRNMEDLLNEPNLENAAKYLNAEVTQERADMTPEQNAAHQASLQKLFNTEVRARKANEKKVGDYSTQLLKDEIKIMEDGGNSAYTEEELDKAFTNSTSKDVRYKYAQQKAIQREQADWGTLSIPEQEDRIALLETKPRKGVDQKLIEQLRTSLKERKTRATKDPVGLAIKEGIIEPTKYRMSAADGVDSLIAGVEDMKNKLYDIKETYGEDKTFLLTTEDAKSWADYFEAPGNSDAKLSTIEKITQYQPEVAKQIFGQISKKNAPAMTFAATLSMDENREGARLSLKGKYAQVSVEDESAIKKEVSAKIGNAFSHFNDPAVYNQMFNGVVNYNRGAVSEGAEALGADDAVEATLGQVKAYNGKDVILPRGATADQFEDWVDTIEIPNNVALQTRIRSATDIFGDRNVQFHYAGQGQYYIHVIRGGKGFDVADEDGKRLILDYNAE